MPPLFHLDNHYQEDFEEEQQAQQEEQIQQQQIQQQQQQQQQQLHEDLLLRERKQQRRYKQKDGVRFHPDVLVYPVMHVTEFTVEEVEACWNTRLDYLRIKQEIATTIYFLSNQQNLVDDFHYTKRGLEGRRGAPPTKKCGSLSHQSNEYHRKQWKRLEVRNAVLEEQEYQRRSRQERLKQQSQQNGNDSNNSYCYEQQEELDFAASWIAAVYQQATRESLLEKQRMAYQDELDAYQYQQEVASCYSYGFEETQRNDGNHPTTATTETTKEEKVEEDDLRDTTFDDDWISSISIQIHASIDQHKNTDEANLYSNDPIDDGYKYKDYGKRTTGIEYYSDVDDANMELDFFDDAWITDVSTKNTQNTIVA